MIRVTQHEIDELQDYIEKLERAKELQDSADEVIELQAKVCRLQNHVIAVDKENAELKAEVAALKGGSHG